MVRIGILLAILILSSATAFAGEGKYIVNFDLVAGMVDTGEIHGTLQQQGIHLQAGQPFHGKDLGEMDYFLTVSEIEDGRGRLTIEFYQYETRKKVSDVVAELTEEVSFNFGSPATFESRNDEFSINLAFSIVQER